MAKYLNSYNINSFANEGAQYDITEMGSKSLDFSTGQEEEMVLFYYMQVKQELNKV